MTFNEFKERVDKIAEEQGLEDPFEILLEALAYIWGIDSADSFLESLAS